MVQADEGRPRTPQEALERLRAGNERFVRGELTAGREVVERRVRLVERQSPFAVVLACSDSRVSPELIFDQGLGELFVCRVAGNVLDPTVLGSIEYAVVNFEPVLVLVVGHERCGAVTAAVELAGGGRTAPGSLRAVVAAISPVLRGAERESADDPAFVESVVRANAKAVARAIVSQSEIVRSAAEAGGLEVFAAHYSLRSGRVDLLA